MAAVIGSSNLDLDKWKRTDGWINFFKRNIKSQSICSHQRHLGKTLWPDGSNEADTNKKQNNRTPNMETGRTQEARRREHQTITKTRNYTAKWTDPKIATNNKNKHTKEIKQKHMKNKLKVFKVYLIKMWTQTQKHWVKKMWLMFGGGWDVAPGVFHSNQRRISLIICQHSRTRSGLTNQEYLPEAKGSLWTVSSINSLWTTLTAHFWCLPLSLC